MDTSKIIEPEITINPVTREVVVPKELYNIGVVTDDNSELVKIRIPRYFDGNDFSTKTCTISINNALNERIINTEKGEEITIEIEDKYLIINWSITKFVTKKSGKIYFVVMFKKEVDERGLSYSWSTLPAEMNIMKGLDDNIVIDESDISLYKSLLFHINATDKKLSDLMQQIGDISLINLNLELLSSQMSDLHSKTDILKYTSAYIDTDTPIMEE